MLRPSNGEVRLEGTAGMWQVHRTPDHVHCLRNSSVESKILLINLCFFSSQWEPSFPTPLLIEQPVHFHDPVNKLFPEHILSSFEYVEFHNTEKTELNLRVV